MRREVCAREAKHGVWLIERFGDSKVGALHVHRVGQTLNQIQRQKRRIARTGCNQWMCGARHADMQAGEWPGETIDGIRNYAMAKGGVLFKTAIGVDENFVNLRLEAIQHMRDHRLPAKKLQPLVNATHARAAAAGEDEAGYFVHLKGIRAHEKVPNPAARPRTN